MVSCENGMELQALETGVEMEMAKLGEKKIAAEGGGGAAAPAEAGSSAAVRWERFLPKMAVRVLLVEADDSTRQIISALLRKCSYKGWFFEFGILLCFRDFGFRKAWNFDTWDLRSVIFCG